MPTRGAVNAPGRLQQQPAHLNACQLTPYPLAPQACQNRSAAEPGGVLQTPTDKECKCARNLSGLHPLLSRGAASCALPRRKAVQDDSRGCQLGKQTAFRRGNTHDAAPLDSRGRETERWRAHLHSLSSGVCTTPPRSTQLLFRHACGAWARGVGRQVAPIHVSGLLLQAPRRIHRTSGGHHLLFESS